MRATIYKITNPLGDFYIGSTTNNFRARIAEHKYNLKRNRKGLLYESFKNFGFENHIFETIITANKLNALNVEHFIIESLDPKLNMVKSYNATATNKIWVNDGANEFQVYKDEVQNYKIGRLYKKF